ncbi:MAG TPA: acetolactate synthase large subunit [Syntrophorhabdales bacterium]|nr:acetolactate synthase large subunit [Syntrophorhabdales bacterium]
MNGAELLVKSAITSGIEVCFINPGTTEMLLVRALDAVPGIRTILGLFEGVCTGAADGFGRMKGKPAMTLFHQGPGLAYGIANLHDAQQARTPVFNVVGDHATWHRAENPTFHLDIEGLAATVSGWLRTISSARTISRDVAEAVAAALRGQIASLVIAQDYQSAEWNGEVESPVSVSPEKVGQEAIDRAATLLRTTSPSALMLGGKALNKSGLAAAARVAAATGCNLFTDIFPACWERGAGLPVVQRTAHLPGQQDMVKYQAVVLAGMEEPVTFSGWEGFKSRILSKEQKKVFLAAPGHDVVEALERLADAIGAPGYSHLPAGLIADYQPPDVPAGELTAAKACQTVAALQPEGAIIVDEGITSSWVYYPMTPRVAPHTLLTVAGVSIGWGMPCAVGAAVASPDRPVITLEADGSAMFTVQALWTQAREALNITTLIFSNRSYNALRNQLIRDGVTAPGPTARSVIELDRPPIDWLGVSRGLGVPAVSVNTAEGLARELRIALAEPGPHLIEMVVQPHGR